MAFCSQSFIIQWLCNKLITNSVNRLNEPLPSSKLLAEMIEGVISFRDAGIMRNQQL